MNKNQKILKEIIKINKLSHAEVASLLGVSIVTIGSWLRPETNKAYREMPDRMIKLLKLQI